MKPCENYSIPTKKRGYAHGGGLVFSARGQTGLETKLRFTLPLFFFLNKIKTKHPILYNRKTKRKINIIHFFVKVNSYC
jgi:hypothetical protein